MCKFKSYHAKLKTHKKQRPFTKGPTAQNKLKIMCTSNPRDCVELTKARREEIRMPGGHSQIKLSHKTSDLHQPGPSVFIGNNFYLLGLKTNSTCCLGVRGS